MDDETRGAMESARDLVHDAAMKGMTPFGEKLPRETDDEGRVWVTCECGKQFLLEDEGEGGAG